MIQYDGLAVLEPMRNIYPLQLKLRAWKGGVKVVVLGAISLCCYQ